MRNFYFPLGLAICGTLLYHISQKSIPNEVNPFLATGVAYMVGIVMCAIFALVVPNTKSLVDSFREINWAVLTLGIGIVAIELGFLMAYRMGWRMSIAAAANSVFVTALLVPIGIIFFKDDLSLRKGIGLVFCILGLIFVVRK